MRSDRDLNLNWSSRWSLTSRILAVNIFAIALLAGSFFWLDSYRVRLLEERVRQTEVQAEFAAYALASLDQAERERRLVRLGQDSRARLRLYGADEALLLDSWDLAEPTYENRDPTEEKWQRNVARWMDAAIETVAGSAPLPAFSEPDNDRLSEWRVALAVQETGATSVELALAPDRTPMVSAAVPLGDGADEILLFTGNARDIRGDVRDERLRLSIIFLIVSILSILLSLFLARTIVRPLRRLSIAAHRVRLGRAREVVIPRLPARRDEIGRLARAVSDMTQALRERIDATEAFAADVTHELKNPLASLHSAVDSLGRVDDPKLQAQLLGVIQDDARRLDRLITDIAEASRVDAELSRAKFERIDVGQLIDGILRAREERGLNGDIRIAFGRPRSGSAILMGDETRLARVIENLLDNAVSFSPPDGVVRISSTADDDLIHIVVEDEGPGVPEDTREEIFERFESIRSAGEDFGKHSGLGLAIAKTIVEGHEGAIRVSDRDDSASGARFTITLPASP